MKLQIANRKSQVASVPRRNARLRHMPLAIRRSQGFTLVELIAAFVIFAIGFGVLLQILSTCLHTTTQSTDYTRVALWAQSLLDTQGIGDPLQEGSYTGKFDERYRWQLNVQKLPPPDDAPQVQTAAGNTSTPPVQATQVAQNNIDLYQLELIVSWGGYYLTHNARFVTLRAQNANPNNAPNLLAPPTPTPTRSTRGKP
jgi:general secretion pathway protein I